MTNWNFATPMNSLEHCNGRCPRGVLYASILYSLLYVMDYYSMYIHILVGSWRCSFNYSGQCEGLSSWDE